MLADKNCTDSNGTWYNNTCYLNNTLPVYAILNATVNSSTEIDLSEVKARSPADEYFQ